MISVHQNMFSWNCGVIKVIQEWHTCQVEANAQEQDISPPKTTLCLLQLYFFLWGDATLSQLIAQVLNMGSVSVCIYTENWMQVFMRVTTTRSYAEAYVRTLVWAHSKRTFFSPSQAIKEQHLRSQRHNLQQQNSEASKLVVLCTRSWISCRICPADFLYWKNSLEQAVGPASVARGVNCHTSAFCGHLCYIAETACKSMFQS